jgi:hypothetical protein
LAKPPNLEELRAVFDDQRQHIGLGQIKKLAVLSDKSAVRVQVSMFPELREIVATMTWEVVGAGSGDYELPLVDDLVIVCFVDGDVDQAYVLKRLSSKVDILARYGSPGPSHDQGAHGKETPPGERHEDQHHEGRP